MHELHSRIYAALEAVKNTIEQKRSSCSCSIYTFTPSEGIYLGTKTDTVFTLEVKLGNNKKTNTTIYGVVQIFDMTRPNLCVTYSIAKNLNGYSTDIPPIYTLAIDNAFATVLLPVLYPAFNTLDPLHKNQSLIVQSYFASLTVGDILAASVYSLWLLNFRKFGQLAQIAVDYTHPFIKGIAGLLTLFKRFIAGLHYIPKTNIPYSQPFAVKQPDDTLYPIYCNSTALQQGLETAQSYIDNR